MLLIASGIDYDPLPEAVVSVATSHVYAPGDKIAALTDRNLQDVAELGFSALQIPVGDFYNRDMDAQGNADWRQLEDNLEILRRHGLRAVLVAGYHWIPPWMRDDVRAVPLRCLQHDREIPIFSLWSSFTYEWIATCTAALADHLQGNLEGIEAIHVSLYGDFGEAIFPAGMLDVQTPCDTREPGEKYHNHGDFWCNDPCARADYVEFLRERSGSVSMSGLDDVAAPELFPVSPQEQGSNRRWLDFVDWYHAGMTHYAHKVVETFRRYFPSEELVIYLGGGVEPHRHGQDNTALPKAMKSVQATIRSTASSARILARQVLGTPDTLALSFQQNYPIVKRIAAACRHYDVPLWLEPPYPPGLEAPAVVARIFEAVSCGATGYLEWTRTLQRQQKVYSQYVQMLTYQQPVVDVAVYFPILSHRSEIDSILPEPFWSSAAQYRRVTDFDVVDDRLIRDGALSRYAILAIPQIDLIEQDVFDCLTRWVDAGGIVVAQDCGPIHTPESSGRDQREWFGVSADTNLLSGTVTGVFSGTMLTPAVRSHLGNRPLLVFDKLTDAGESMLSTPAGTAIVRCHHGRGSTLFCASRSAGPCLSVGVLADVVGRFSETAKLACREGYFWMQQYEQAFATVLSDYVLLANLSPEPVVLSRAGLSVRLQPYDLSLVPFSTEE